MSKGDRLEIMKNNRMFQRQQTNPVDFSVDVSFERHNGIYFTGKLLDISKYGALVGLIKVNSKYSFETLKEYSGYAIFKGISGKTYTHGATIIRIDSDSIMKTIGLQFRESIEFSPLGYYLNRLE